MNKSTVLAIGVWFAFNCINLTAENTPKYKPCLPNNPGCYSRNLSSGMDCTNRCRPGPMRITPDSLEACEGQTVTVNVRVDGDSLDNHGDQVNWIGGQIDWGDGQTTPLQDVRPHDYAHSYTQARDYFPSADYVAEYKYDGAGSCSYHCEQQQSATATIHLKTAPECKGGIFAPRAKTKASKPKSR